MDYLQRLPTELLSRIVSLIPAGAWGGGDEPPTDLASSEERRALYNLSLVSRQLRDVAQPFMVRYLEVSDHKDPYPDGGLVQNHIQLLMRFAIALCLNPELGKHVRIVEIDSFAKPGPRNTTALGPDFHTVLGAALDELPLPDQEGRAGVRLTHGHGILERLSRLREPCPSILSRLEQLHITLSDHTETGYSIPKYTPLLTLPRLREFSFEDADLYGKSCPDAWKPGTLETQEISLSHCHCDASGVKKLIKACKKLTGFTFQTLSSHDDSFNARGRGPHEPNAAGIHAALLPHKETLEFLQLDLRVKLPSLRDFPLLEFVEIQHALLPEHPQFSPALKRLLITDCNSSIRNMVGNIAADCKNGLYPKFEGFRVSALDITRPIKLPGQRIPQGQTPEQCFRSLGAVFEGTSVNFQIIPHALDMMDDGAISISDDDSEDDHDGDLEAPFPNPFINAGDPDIPATMMMMQQAMNNPALAARLLALGGVSDDS
ncbi:hypothetical protein BJY00DRAFT_316404 [Aspergillus carlsbadensis]|nr:hypothetical protein BJY00DRAFT_316404 [Aspergillus carlsbadensis]